MHLKIGVMRMAISICYALSTRWLSLTHHIRHELKLYSQSAVVRGAALRGLESIVPRVKHVRVHYGIALGQPFREGVDPEKLAYYGLIDDTKLCSRMNWLIEKVSLHVFFFFTLLNKLTNTILI